MDGLVCTLAVISLNTFNLHFFRRNMLCSATIHTVTRWIADPNSSDYEGQITIFRDVPPYSPVEFHIPELVK
jgi:hypothetical protein